MNESAAGCKGTGESRKRRKEESKEADEVKEKSKEGGCDYISRSIFQNFNARGAAHARDIVFFSHRCKVSLGFVSKL